MAEVRAELSQYVLQILQASIDAAALCIASGTHCWTLTVDILVAAFGGNLLDAVLLAVKAALATVALPRVTVNDGLVSEDSASINAAAAVRAPPTVEVDESACTPLEVRDFPLSLTVNVVPAATNSPLHFFYDASVQEEAAAVVRLNVLSTRSGKISAVKKSGSGALPPSLLVRIVQEARDAFADLFALYDANTA